MKIISLIIILFNSWKNKFDYSIILISKTLLSQTLTTEIVASDIEFLEKWLNRLVEIICWVNYGKCEVPKISLEEEVK